jgi:thiamine-monophosphate kinase
LAEGTLARLAGAHAMIDVSDGLALDLHRLADQSGVGFALDRVPVAEGASRAEALGGGEDYELVLTLAEADAVAFEGACREAGFRAPVRLGVVVPDAGHRTLDGEDLGPLGWQHAIG